jgi:hypothetical protein
MRLNGGVVAGFVTAGMAGHAPAAMEDRDGHGGVACIAFTVDERVGHAVEVTRDFNVVIDVDACLVPLYEGIGFGWQRPQARRSSFSAR